MVDTEFFSATFNALSATLAASEYLPCCKSIIDLVICSFHNVSRAWVAIVNRLISSTINRTVDNAFMLKFLLSGCEFLSEQAIFYQEQRGTF